MTISTPCTEGTAAMPEIDEDTDFLDRIYPPESWITPRVTKIPPMPSWVVPPRAERPQPDQDTCPTCGAPRHDKAGS
jgi:hypothetical protein